MIIFNRALVTCIALVCISCSPARQPAAPAVTTDHWPTFEELTQHMEGERMEGNRYQALDGPGTLVNYLKTERAISFIWLPNVDRIGDREYLAACQRNRAAFFAAVFPEWQGANSTFGVLTTTLRHNIQVPYNHTLTDVAPGDRLMLVVKWIEEPLP